MQQSTEVMLWNGTSQHKTSNFISEVLVALVFVSIHISAHASLYYLNYVIEAVIFNLSPIRSFWNSLVCPFLDTQSNVTLSANFLTSLLPESMNILGLWDYRCLEKLRKNCQWTKLTSLALDNMRATYFLPYPFTSYYLHCTIHLNYWHLLWGLFQITPVSSLNKLLQSATVIKCSPKYMLVFRVQTSKLLHIQLSQGGTNTSKPCRQSAS